MNEKIMKQENEEEEENCLTWQSVKREHIENDKPKDKDPLALQSPVAISFKILKKEEIVVKKVTDVKNKDLMPEVIPTTYSQHAASDHECENADDRRLMNALQNDLPSSSQNIEKKIVINGEQHHHPILSSLLSYNVRNYEEILNVPKKKLNYHMKDKMYACDDCHKPFTSFDCLKIHIKVLHLGVDVYKCEHCYKTFSGLLKLKMHINSVHKSNKLKFDSGKLYTCGDCDEKCSGFNELKNHILLVHLGFGSYKCEECNITFSQLIHLEIHIGVVHKSQNLSFYEKRKFTCGDCDNKYVSKKTLRGHIKSVHLRLCNKYAKCNIKFSSPNLHKSHVDMVHKNGNLNFFL